MTKDFDIINYESSRWSRAVDGASVELSKARDEILREAAARGFPALPGEFASILHRATFDVKNKLEDENAKIATEVLEKILKECELAKKIDFGLKKLDLQAYQAEIETALTLEKAEVERDLDEQRAYLDRLKADVDLTQVALIEARAEIEHETNYWKKLAIEAQGANLDLEVQLAQEKLATAEERGKIIDLLYDVVSAERLAIQAEERRADALKKVLEAERKVAEVRREMIPLMIAKADARERQAVAITQEAAARKELEELGYRRIELKRLQEEGEHTLKQEELRLEQARKELVEKQTLNELARQIARRKLLEFETALKKQLLIEEEEMRKDDKQFDIARNLFWTNFQTNNDIESLDLARKLLVLETNKKIDIIKKVASSKSSIIRSSSEKHHVRISTGVDTTYISKG